MSCNECLPSWCLGLHPSPLPLLLPPSLLAHRLISVQLLQQQSLPSQKTHHRLWLTMKSQHSLTPSLFSLLSLFRTRRETSCWSHPVGGSRVIPPDKQTLCGTVKFINTNKADIDDSKWQHSYAALRRSMWLPCGLLGKQAILFSLMSVWWRVRLRWGMREAREHRTCGCLRGEGGCSILGTWMPIYCMHVQ